MLFSSKSKSPKASPQSNWSLTIANANLVRHAKNQAWPLVFKILKESANAQELINSKNIHGHNALYYALLAQTEEPALELLLLGASAQNTYKLKNYDWSKTPLLQKSAQLGKPLEMPALSLAVTQGKLKVIYKILKQHPHLLKVKDTQQSTPLMMALNLNNLEAFKTLFLFSNLEDLNETNAKGETVLNLLCQNNFSHLQIDRERVRILLDLANRYPNIDVDTPNKSGNTILIDLCASGFEYPKMMLFAGEKEQKIRLCLKFTKNINYQNKEGLTALMTLIKYQNYNMACVVAATSNLSIKNNQGQTALDIAYLEAATYASYVSPHSSVNPKFMLSNYSSLPPLIDLLETLSQKTQLEQTLHSPSSLAPKPSNKV